VEPRVVTLKLTGEKHGQYAPNPLAETPLVFVTWQEMFLNGPLTASTPTTTKTAPLIIHEDLKQRQPLLRRVSSSYEVVLTLTVHQTFKHFAAFATLRRIKKPMSVFAALSNR